MFSTNARILLVDDIPYFRDLVRNTLLTLGYKNVVQASDGEKALQMLEQSTVGLSIHLVICDFDMPKVNGVELLKKVRETEQLKNLPFILLTSEADPELVTSAIQAGVSQYIIKPFSLKTFEEKLRSAYIRHNK